MIKFFSVFFVWVFPDAEQLWVLDSVPGEVNTENSDGEVEKVLQTLQGLPSTVPSRKYTFSSVNYLFVQCLLCVRLLFPGII